MKTFNKSILALALLVASAIGTANASIIQIGDNAQTANECNITIGDFSQNLNDGGCAEGAAIVGAFSIIREGAWRSAAFGNYNRIGVGSFAGTLVGSSNTIEDGVVHATGIGNGNILQANNGFAGGWTVTIGPAAVDGIGIGTFANVQAVDGIAIGHNSRVNAGHDRSLALGSQTQTSKANEAAFGYRQVTQVEDGVDPTDAVNVRQLVPMAEAFGGGATLDNGVFMPPNYGFRDGTNHSNVGSALDNLDRRLYTLEQNPPGTGTGPAGPAGQDGAPGERGERGEQGVAGNDGAPGERGEQGVAGNDGAPGERGERGEQGVAGTNGLDGRSAYEVAVADGFTGTQTEWLASLEGTAGRDGIDGRDGGEDPLAVRYDGEDKGSITLEGEHGTTISNVAPGRIEQGSTEAVNGGQIWALEQDFNDRWTEVNHRITGLEGAIDAVGAQGAALTMMSGAGSYLPVGKVAISAGYGQYGSKSAFAVGAKVRLTERASASFGLSATPSGGGKLMFGAGVSYILP